jgi:uncharacterized protein (TIGR04255 family)
VHFERPPVAEVILATQFDPDAVDIETYGRFAEQIRRELPVRARQELVPSVEETFDRPPVMGSLQIRLEEQAPLPRILFASEDGVELVQLQPHRLTLNWRGFASGAPYPRYAHLRRRFRQLLRRLTGALAEIERPHAINLSQVTYVNPIKFAAAGADDDAHPDLAKIINRLCPTPQGSFLPDAEDLTLNARWRIPASALGGTGGPVGRLHLAVEPGLIAPTNPPGNGKPPRPTPIYAVKLTAHVIPRGASVDRGMKAMDVGHEWVVLGFKDLTTSEMHKHWGLRR